MGRRRRAWLTGGDGRRKGAPGYYAEWHEYAGGRSRHRSKHFLTAKAAREWVRRWNARQDLREIGEIVPLTIREALEEFLPGCAALARNTRMEYARSAGFLAAIVGEGRMMHEVTGADVDRFIASRLADERSANTAAKHVRNIRRLFRWALARGHVERDPTTEATALPKTSARVRPTVTERQLAALYRALDTEDRRLAFSIAITAGLDRDVISRLTSENIDADGAAFIFKRPKTGTVLLVPIHRDLLPEILARLDRIPPGRPLLQGLARERPERDWWKRATVAAGVPGLWFRDLRSLAVSRPKLSSKAGQALLGHASAITTEKYYRQADPLLREQIDSVPIPGRPSVRLPRRAKPA
jgi:integrase